MPEPPPDIIELKIRMREMPPAFTTPKNRSSAVPPKKLLSPIFGATMLPRNTPEASQASKVTVFKIAPSVQTIPACVGEPPSATASNVNVNPMAPEPKIECPLPSPSIAPSSASTESISELLGNTTVGVGDVVTPGGSNSPSSMSSRWKEEKLEPLKGLSENCR